MSEWHFLRVKMENRERKEGGKAMCQKGSLSLQRRAVCNKYWSIWDRRYKADESYIHSRSDRFLWRQGGRERGEGVEGRGALSSFSRRKSCRRQIKRLWPLCVLLRNRQPKRARCRRPCWPQPRYPSVMSRMYIGEIYDGRPSLRTQTPSPLLPSSFSSLSPSVHH